MTTLADVHDFLMRASREEPDLFYQIISGLREFKVLSPWGKVIGSSDTWVREGETEGVLATVFYDARTDAWRWNIPRPGARPEVGESHTLDGAQKQVDERLSDEGYILPTTAMDYTPRYRPVNRRRGGERPLSREEEPGVKIGGGSSFAEAFQNAWKG